MAKLLARQHPVENDDGAVMSQDDKYDDNRYMKLYANRGDNPHDLQLLRDLAIINSRTVAEMGSLPAGGVPVVEKRRLKLPRSIPAVPSLTRAYHQDNQTMDFKPMAVAAGMALAACTPMENPSHDEQSPHAAVSRKDDSPMQARKFRLNPNPKQRYDITMSIKDAPGPFEYVRFAASYEAKGCSYVISEFGGVIGNPDKSVELQFNRLDGNTYVGTLYLDAMMDEDYYGNGVCHWQLTGMGIGLMAAGAEDETRFSSSLMLDSIKTQSSKTTYFRKEVYPKDSLMDGFITSGQENRTVFASKYGDDDLFTVTLAAKKVFP